MKKQFLLCLACVMCASGFAGPSAPTVKKKEAVAIITNSTATEYEFLTSEGVLPVYRSKEKYFVIRTSQSSGAVYRQYLNLGVIKGRLSKCE